MKVYTVVVHLNNSSQPIIYKDVVNGYEKGSFYCLYLSDDKVIKYPLASIWRVIEDYHMHEK